MTIATKPVLGTQADRQEACKTFLEQTKQLITLGSAFLFAPAAFVTLDKELMALHRASTVCWFLGTEACFVLSVVLGYVTIGTIAGTQNDGSYNVFRKATRLFSLGQFACYVFGILAFGKRVLKFLPLRESQTRRLTSKQIGRKATEQLGGAIVFTALPRFRANGQTTMR